MPRERSCCELLLTKDIQVGLSWVLAGKTMAGSMSVGCFSNVLEIPILVTTLTPVDPVTWGTLKSRFGAPDPPKESQP